MATPLEALLSISQSMELSILIKATAVLAFGLTAARLARRARAAVRHLLLAATFVALIVLPLVAAAAPGLVFFVPIPPRHAAPAAAVDGFEAPGRAATAAAAEGAAHTRRSDAITWAVLLRWGWASGCALVILSLAAAYTRAAALRRQGLPRPELRRRLRALADESGIRRPVEVLEHEALPAPLTCGIWRPAILLPAAAREWNEGDLERALIHELEHVRRGDCLTQLAARAACAAYWFHPFAWMALRRLCLEAERACDDAVARGAERTDYANQLVMLARRLSTTPSPAALGMANRSDLAARVGALLDDRQRRGRAGRAATVAAALAAAVVVAAIAPVRAVARIEAPAASAADQRERRDGARRRAGARDRALYEAAEAGDQAEVEALLLAGANANAAVDGDGSPLMGAVRSGQLPLVRYLLDRGADVDMPVDGDGSPLIVAAAEGRRAIAELLLDRGAAVDQLVPGDESALIQASAEGHLDLVTLLVARGANVSLGVWVDGDFRGDREWRSPLSVARRNGHTAVVEFLRSAGAQE